MIPDLKFIILLLTAVARLDLLPTAQCRRGPENYLLFFVFLAALPADPLTANRLAILRTAHCRVLGNC